MDVSGPRPEVVGRVGLVASAAGLASMAATAVLVGTGGVRGTAAVAVAEPAALMLLAAIAGRWARGRPGAGATALAAVAVPLWLLRREPVSALPWTGVAAWTAVALAAVGVGLYLRSLDERRRRSVLDARREQRLRLAADLHDFVAHDVSEMLARAQAGQFQAERDAAAATQQFQGIEAAAQRALAALDRTVHMLHREGGAHGEPEDGRAPLPGLDDLPELADRFRSAGPVRVVLDLRASTADVSRQASVTAYRVVVEALTNVRRHAREVSRVEVAVHLSGPAWLEVRVTDDGGPPRPGLRRGRSTGGRGLSGLSAQVAALGGEFTAGPERDGGWQLTARLPARG